MVRIVHGYHGHESFHGGSEGTFAAYDDNGKLCGFGGVEIRQGYDPGEFSGLQGFGADPPPPNNSADVMSAIDAFSSTVDTFKSSIESINARLLTAAQSQGGSTLNTWQSWHNSAVSWENYAGTVVTQLQQIAQNGALTPNGWAALLAWDASGVWASEFPGATGGLTPAEVLVNDFIAQGVQLINDAKSAMSVIMYDDSLMAAISEVGSKLPDALLAALNAILQLVGHVAASVTWSAAKVVLIATAAVAAGLYLLRRFGGLSGNYGPVKAASYNGYSRRRKRRR